MYNNYMHSNNDEEEEVVEEVAHESQSISKTVEEERDEYLAGWKRALADYENIKKDSAKERQSTRQWVIAEMMIAYLPIYDHLESATKNSPDIPEAKEWFKGVGFIRDQVKSIMNEYGVVKIETEGQKFDTHIHESVGSEVRTELDEEIIISEVQSGFMLNGKLLRPAKVIINKLT